MFGRKKNERRVDPEALLGHLVAVATREALEGSEESADRLSKHLVEDLEGICWEDLAATLGMAVVLEGHARAEHIKRGLSSAVENLLAHLGHDDAEGPQERPTDLLPDDEPTTAPEAVSEPQEPAEKVWPEDRR